ncbi:MBL fold metallo-hydrolase [Anaerotignum sp.]
MKLKILMDNHTEIDVYYLGEPAVSYWIETEGKAFLFDAGYSDAFLKNAETMGIDVTKAEAVLLSHSHNDHTGGLKPLLGLDFAKKPVLIAHPDALLPHDWNGMDIGSPVSREELSEKFTLQLGKEPVWLTEKLVWLGEIPHTVDFEPAYAIGTVEKDGKQQTDYIMDDTALAFVGEQGLSIITGCSHAGICNIIAYAKKLTGVEKVQSVLGGFHLFHVDERAKATISYLKEENIPELYPCHCTSFAVRAALHGACPVKEVAVGTELEWK